MQSIVVYYKLQVHSLASRAIFKWNEYSLILLSPYIKLVWLFLHENLETWESGSYSTKKGKLLTNH